MKAFLPSLNSIIINVNYSIHCIAKYSTSHHHCKNCNNLFLLVLRGLKSDILIIKYSFLKKNYNIAIANGNHCCNSPINARYIPILPIRIINFMSYHPIFMIVHLAYAMPQASDPMGKEKHNEAQF